MRSLVPVGHFRNISEHLFTWLVCESFQWRHGLLFTDCIVWDDQDKVMFLKDHIGSTEDDGVPGLQSFNCFNYHSIHTSPTVDWYLLQLTFHEIWHKNAKCSYLKVPGIKSYILSRGQCFSKDIFFQAVCLSKRYTKVPEVVFTTSL